MQVLYTAMALLLAAANRCPPLLKQQSLQAFIGNSVSSLLAVAAWITLCRPYSLNLRVLVPVGSFTPLSGQQSLVHVSACKALSVGSLLGEVLSW